MVCANCTHKKVCTHFLYAAKNALEYSKCPYKENAIEGIASSRVNNSHSTADNIALLNDLNSFKKTLITEKNKGFKKDFKKDKENIKKEVVSCPTCDGLDYKEMLTICDKCSETICGNCGTCIDGNNYCAKCYGEL